MKTFVVCIMITGISFLSTYAQSPYSVSRSGVVVTVADTVTNGAKLVRVEPITGDIIRVTAVNASHFPDIRSLMIATEKLPAVKWSGDQKGDIVVLKTAALQVRISAETGALVFCRADGTSILTELKSGGKTIEPVTLEGRHLFRIRDQFESPAGEAFYGLGQQQEGLFNYKGHDVDLFQYNTKISIPFVVSNRNYGILWDNYSRSKFGDPREYGDLSSLFKLYDAGGKEGGLTAKYAMKADTSTNEIVRDESEIDYEFIPDLKKLPQGYSLTKGEVT